MRESVIEMLTSSSLYEYIKGIDTVNQLYSDNKAAIAIEQEIMERVLSVLVYEKFYDHDEWAKALGDVMEVLPRHLHLMEDFINKYTLKGMMLFVNGMLNGSKDMSGFMMAVGTSFLIPSTESLNLAALIKESDEEGSKVMTDFSEILKEMFSAQMSAKGLIIDFKEWDKPTCAALYNVFSEAERNIKCEMLYCLALQKGNEAITEHIITPYEDVLAKLKMQFEEAGEAEKIAAVEEMQTDLKESYYDRS